MYVYATVGLNLKERPPITFHSPDALQNVSCFQEQAFLFPVECPMPIGLSLLS